MKPPVAITPVSYHKLGGVPNAYLFIKWFKSPPPPDFTQITAPLGVPLWYISHPGYLLVHNPITLYVTKTLFLSTPIEIVSLNMVMVVS